MRAALARLREALGGRSRTLRAGPYLLAGNVWNRGAGDRGGQRLRIGRAADGAPTYEWRWTWAERSASAPVSYPGIVFGKKPWLRDASTTATLPRRLAELRRLEVACDYTVQAPGRWCVALILWFTRTAAADAASICGEVAVWLQAADVRPDGAPLETLDGSALLRVERTAGAARWPLHTLHLDASPPRALDLLPWLRALTERGLLDRDAWLASVEFGTEIWHSAGLPARMRVHHYHVGLE